MYSGGELVLAELLGLSGMKVNACATNWAEIVPAHCSTGNQYQARNFPRKGNKFGLKGIELPYFSRLRAAPEL